MSRKLNKSMQELVAPLPSVGILTDQTTFDAAMERLASVDPAFVAAIRGGTPHTPALRRRSPGFEGLASIVLAQQVSTASADAIFGRLKARLGTIDATGILGTTDADLRLCGLSAAKIRTMRAVAEAELAGLLDFGTLADGGADIAHAKLIAVKGIGPWTADIFLLFCLGQADAWPAGDLALQEAARLILGFAARPIRKPSWRLANVGVRTEGVAAHCLWAYYNAARIKPVP